MNKVSYPKVNQEIAKQSLFNLEGAIERLCTFKRGKEKDKFRGPCINRKVEIWGCSSAGRAPALQAGGQEFDPPHLHQRASEDEETTTVARTNMGL